MEQFIDQNVELEQLTVFRTGFVDELLQDKSALSSVLVIRDQISKVQDENGRKGENSGWIPRLIG